MSARSINLLMDDFFALCGMIRDEADDEGMLDPSQPLNDAADMKRHKELQMASYERLVSVISLALRKDILADFEREMLKARRILDIIVTAEEAAGYASTSQVHEVSRKMELLVWYARVGARKLALMSRKDCAQRAVSRKADELQVYWLWLPI